MSEIGTFETICDVCGFSYDPTDWEHEKLECLQVLHEKALASHQALESENAALKKCVEAKDEALRFWAAQTESMSNQLDEARDLTPASLTERAKLEREVVEAAKELHKEWSNWLLSEHREMFPHGGVVEACSRLAGLLDQLAELREKTNSPTQEPQK